MPILKNMPGCLLDFGRGSVMKNDRIYAILYENATSG